MAIGKTIGKQLDNGFPGGYAIQPDQLIDTHVNSDTADIKFGVAVALDTTKAGELVGVKNITTVDDVIAGITVRQVKQGDRYFEQGEAVYKPKDAVAVMKRGQVSILVVDGANTVKYNGDVYYRFTANGSDKPVGFTPAEDSDKTVKLDNVKFSGVPDANGVVSVVILTKKNA